MHAPRILVLRGGAIGDFILTLPALQALRERWPRAYVELVGYPHVAELARLGGLADRVASLDAAHVSRWFSLHPDIPPAQAEHVRSFDFVLSYLYDPEDIVRRNLLNAGARQVLYGTPLVHGSHACDFLCRPLAELAIFPEAPLVPRLRLSQAHVEAGRQRLGTRGARAFVLHPGSGGAKKNWPLDRFVALADRVRAAGLAAPRYVLGEADEELRTKLAAAGLGESLLTGLTLAELAGVLAAASAFVGNDSGVAHLAAALGVPTVAVYGPTDPAVWGVRGDRARCVQDPGRGENAWASLPASAVEAELRSITATSWGPPPAPTG